MRRSTNVQPLGRGKGIGENEILRRTAQTHIRPLLILRQDKKLCPLQASDDQIAHLRRRFAARELVDIDSLDGEQLVRKVLLSKCRKPNKNQQKYLHPCPAFRASSS